MKHVLQIAKYMYPFIGGVEQVTRDIATALAVGDIEQRIICFNEDSADGDYVSHRGDTVKDMVDGVEVVRCGSIAKLASQPLSLTYHSELKKLFDDFRPNVVIFHYPDPYAAAFVLPMLDSHVEFILFWHLDITKQKILGRIFHNQSMELLRRANRIIATSKNYIEGSPYLCQFKDKCVVIPCSIQKDRFPQSDGVMQRAAEIRKKHAGKTICFAAGRHVPYKGMAYLIEAAHYLDESFAVIIGGQGPLTKKLQKQAGDDKKLFFTGQISDGEMAAYYMACDIFCFPSITKNEAFGISLAEAMSYGKPAVTFTIPGSGVNYVSLKNETGLECPNRDSRAYARALQLLGQDQGLRTRYGKAARERTEKYFTVEKFQKEIRKVVGS